MTPTTQPQAARRRGGFSLIEIIAVLILLGILAVIAASVLPRSNASLATQANQLSANLRYAQIRAQADTYQWRLVFTDATTYQIGQVIVPGAGFKPAVVPGTSTTQGTLTDGVTAPAGTAIRFDSWGRPLNDAGALLASDQTITLTQGSLSESVVIRANTGFIP
ncbi:S23 ribosomal protein [Haloferula helveola]|uniref:S23 ribosomal protein n=1 Tax=Haloferula helveola TaxID=490095 RepID=A0ABN6H014_9BACT|nr:S23 ribosomal protein [Haloferula helveola]